MRARQVLENQRSVANEIRKLESRLWRRVHRGNMKTLMFTSALQGEGKSTTVALFSAAAALHRERRILAVDLDFRRPSLHRHFAVEPGSGLRDFLLGGGDLDRAIVPTEIPNLWAVPGFTVTDEDPDRLLNSPLLAKALQVFRDRFDLVVLDVPAILPVADAASLVPLADGVLLVVMVGKSSKHHMSRAREIILDMDGNLLGVVVGNVQEIGSEYQYQEHNAAREEMKEGSGRAEAGTGSS